MNNILRISKILDYITYVAIVALIVYYFFGSPIPELMMILLLLTALLKMVGSVMRANYYTGENFKLKEDNEFLARRVKELESMTRTNEEQEQ